MPSFAGERLSCVRGGRQVFSAVDFCIEGGGALVLAGPNGSGKSSLLRVMAGLLPAVDGRLMWNGETLDVYDQPHRERVHYVGHADTVKPALTCRETLRFWAHLYAVQKTTDADAAVARGLDAFGLGRLADVSARYLSQGQRRRLALSRLVAVDAVLWLLDEPRTALDRAAQHDLDRVIQAHRTGGGMVVLAQHGDGAPACAQVLDLAAAEQAPAC